MWVCNYMCVCSCFCCYRCHCCCCDGGRGTLTTHWLCLTWPCSPSHSPTPSIIHIQLANHPSMRRSLFSFSFSVLHSTFLLFDALLIVVRNCVVVVVGQWNFLAEMSKVRSNSLKIRTLGGCGRLTQQLWQIGTLVYHTIMYVTHKRWLEWFVVDFCVRTKIILLQAYLKLLLILRRLILFGYAYEDNNG